MDKCLRESLTLPYFAVNWSPRYKLLRLIRDFKADRMVSDNRYLVRRCNPERAMQFISVKLNKDQLKENKEPTQDRKISDISYVL